MLINYKLIVINLNLVYKLIVHIDNLKIPGLIYNIMINKYNIFRLKVSHYFHFDINIS